MAREGEGAGPAGHAPRGAASDACTCASLPTGVTATRMAELRTPPFRGAAVGGGPVSRSLERVRAEITPGRLPTFSTTPHYSVF